MHFVLQFLLTAVASARVDDLVLRRSNPVPGQMDLGP